MMCNRILSSLVVMNQIPSTASDPRTGGSNAGAAVGGAIVGILVVVVVIVLLLLAVWWYWRRYVPVVRHDLYISDIACDPLD